MMKSMSRDHAVEVLALRLGAEGFQDLERYSALESIRPWLEERGYFLYHHFYHVDHDGIETAPFSYPHFQDGEPNSAPQLPYSFYGGGFVWNGQKHVVQSPSMYHMTFAQDIQRRHVALKLAKEGSAEYEAYRRLSQEKSLYTLDPVEFGCVMPPLDFVDAGNGWWFIVMPRWGPGVLRPWFDTVREVLHFMQSCLEGLCVLHKHFIIYRDVKHANILVNHFAQGDYFKDESFRPSLRKTGRLSYALIDFDWSIVLPLGSKPSEVRLPASESFILACSSAYDTYQGELDYDPAFDVGSLGMLFCEDFQHLSTMVPMLAPFLDRMITRDIPTRFTAMQALSFFNDQVLPSVAPSILDDHPPSCGRGVLPEPEVYDRWAGLDPEFVDAWAAYRLPPLKWSTKMLRWMCCHPLLRAVVQSTRKLGRVLGAARCLMVR